MYKILCFNSRCNGPGNILLRPAPNSGLNNDSLPKGPETFKISSLPNIKPKVNPIGWAASHAPLRHTSALVANVTNLSKGEFLTHHS